MGKIGSDGNIEQTKISELENPRLDSSITDVKKVQNFECIKAED